MSRVRGLTCVTVPDTRQLRGYGVALGCPNHGCWGWLLSARVRVLSGFSTYRRQGSFGVGWVVFVGVARLQAGARSSAKSAAVAKLAQQTKRCSSVRPLVKCAAVGWRSKSLRLYSVQILRACAAGVGRFARAGVGWRHFALVGWRRAGLVRCGLVIYGPHGPVTRGSISR